MSFFRVIEPNVAAVPIPDLGITIAQNATSVLSNFFSVNDLYLSADLEALIINGDLDVEIDYGTGFAAVAAGDYTNRDALAAFLNVFEITNQNNNEDLVDGSDVGSLHNHNGAYYTKSELNALTGAALIGVSDDAWDTEYPFVFDDLQEFIDGLYPIISAIAATAPDLDDVYDNDVDGIMNVDGVAKPLIFRSNNTNDIVIDRTDLTDIQDALRLDVSGDELLLGNAVVGGLAQIDVRVKTNLVIDGNLTVTGTVTDTTVDTLNVTNANIRLRDGATGIAGANAYVEVERGTSGNDARLEWDETSDRWLAGIVGDMDTIALLERNELVTGIWEFQGGGATDPNLYLDNKAAAPTTNLGAADQIPISMINNAPAYYDKTRTKWLGYSRQHVYASGRDNSNNSNEYMRIGDFTSNQTGARMLRNMTIFGITAQTNGSETWTARIRKNGVVTNIASLALAAVEGAQDVAVNVDVNAGDEIEVYCDGTNINRPFVTIELAPRY